MIPIIPTELDGKIKFCHHDVKIKDDVTLSEEEMKVFQKFRNNLVKGFESRFE